MNITRFSNVFLCTQVEQALDRDNIDYDSVSVNLTTLNSGRYRATIIVESNDTKRMGTSH